MRNRFKVPKKQWRKWNVLAKSVFNEVYDSIRDGYKTLFPAKAKELPAQTIKVIAWNTAWIAADAANS